MKKANENNEITKELVDKSAETSSSSYRKPYQEEIQGNWWQKLWFYRCYIVRESTSIFMLWFSMILLYGISTIQANEFYLFLFFLKKPIIMIINGLALISALIHTVTWFNLAPKATNFIFGERKLPSAILVALLWAMLIASSWILLKVVLRF